MLYLFYLKPLYYLHIVATIFSNYKITLLFFSVCNMAHLQEDEINHIELHHNSTSGIILHTSTKHHGISLWPPPSNDPHDPLRWPQWLKILALFTTALCNFTGNLAASGPSVATQLFEAQFMKSASQVNDLMTVCNHLYSNLICTSNANATRSLTFSS